MGVTEIRAELRLDDLASSTLSKLQGGFGKVNTAVGNATRGMMDFVKQTAAVAIGVNLTDIFGSIRDMSTSAFHEAVRADEQMKTLSRTMAGLSATRGKDLLAFRREASQVHGELSKISREAHVSREALIDAFTKAGANTRKTGTELTALIEKSAKASRVLGVPVQEVVQGYMELEKNVVSANNPIIAMVKQTNMLRGHSERIAQKFQFMGRWGKERLANKALDAMAAKAKEIPLTFDEMNEQLKEMRMDTLRLVGEPMMNALRPMFEQFTGWLEENRTEIEAFAKATGEKAREWIEGAAKAAQEGFRYLQTHAEEIKRAITSAFDFAKKTFKWMIENKGLVAGAVVGSQVAGPAAQGGAAAVKFSKAITEVARTGIPALGLAASGAAAGLTGVAVTLGAFAAAVAGVMLAVDQFRRLMSETNEAQLDQEARFEALDRYAQDFREWDAKTIKAFDEMKAKIVRNAAQMGEDSRAAGEAVERAYAQHKALVEATRGMQTGERIAEAIKFGGEEGMTEDQLYEQAQMMSQASQTFTAGMLDAGQASNKAAVDAGIKILAGSKNLQESLLRSGMLSAQELTDLADLIGDKLGEFSAKLREQADIAGKAAETTEKGAVPLNVFNGGQTFQIKQDFRDQDPDRIAFIFQRDLAAAAENRLQARTSLPFGG